jgi:hypothetical protein
LVLASLTQTSKLVALAIAGHSIKHKTGKALFIIIPQQPNLGAMADCTESLSFCPPESVLCLSAQQE